jgi:hypothetical protein
MSNQNFIDHFDVLETGAKIIPLDKWIQFHQPMFGKPTIGGGPFSEQHAIDMYNIFVKGLSQPKKEKNV